MAVSNIQSGVATWLVGLIYVAVLFVLVRPGSQGPSLVTAVTGGMTNLMNAATGGGGWAAGATS
ncbi:MAG TPA: hypothetical protein VGG50_11530 [Streptosporangiaceae bacterium]|jgi:hypothetical protein